MVGGCLTIGPYDGGIAPINLLVKYDDLRDFLNIEKSCLEKSNCWKMIQLLDYISSWRDAFAEIF